MFKVLSLFLLILFVRFMAQHHVPYICLHNRKLLSLKQRYRVLINLSRARDAICYPQLKISSCVFFFIFVLYFDNSCKCLIGHLLFFFILLEMLISSKAIRILSFVMFRLIAVNTFCFHISLRWNPRNEHI